MPESVGHQYQDAQGLSERQQQFVEDCATAACKHRTRLRQLLERVQSMRLDCSFLDGEESQVLEQQNKRLAERRTAAHSREKAALRMQDDLERHRREMDYMRKS